jgi:alanine dehydrogenase
MRVGVPKEIKVHEYRVGLTPASVAELTAAGHEVVVETRAGEGIDFPTRPTPRSARASCRTPTKCSPMPT